MISELFTNPIAFLFSLVAIIVAITVHEFAHALVADRLGDPTPSLQGRLTLNPLAHLDPIGTLLLIIARFGWGKPVQFDPFNLRHPRRDAALISLAGPASNLLMAGVGSLLLRLVIGMQLTASAPFGLSTNLLLTFLTFFVSTNVILAVFNLIPLHPLDGFKIVGGLLSEEHARSWWEMEHYSTILLIIMLVTGTLSNIISGPISFFLRLFLPSAPFI